MNKHQFAWENFFKIPIIGIVRNIPAEAVKEIAPLYADAGFYAIEITMNTSGACDIIQYLRRSYPALATGAGTVCTQSQLEKAIDAGAQFIVSPLTDKKIIKACVKKQLPVFPGAFTPTEIYKAWDMGASMVKLYPAKTLGTGYVKDIKAPFNQVKLLPTGGIGLEDIAPFRAAGADGFGIGSPLFNQQLIGEKNWPALLEHFKKFANAVSL